MSLQIVLSTVGVLTEIAIICLLLYRRIGRTLPIFLVYCLWALISDATALAVTLNTSQGYGINFYVATTLIDLTLQLAVIVELAWSVLRPLRSGLSPHALWVVAGLVLAVGAAIWPLAGSTGIAFHSRNWQLVVQLQQTVSILRVLFFVGLAACCQFLGLGWRDRELQVATGFGFYSMVSIFVTAINSHLTTGDQYKKLYWVVAFSFLGSLFYWVISFAQKDAVRREFSPQTKQALMSVARSAHIARTQLEESRAAKREGL